MAIEGRGRVTESNKGRVIIYIPAAVHGDSQWPFEVGQNVKVKINGTEVTISDFVEE